MSKNAFTRPSVLRLETKYDGEKTVVDEVYFTSPLKVLPPIYLADQTAQVFVLADSAGMLEGDTQQFAIRVGKNSKLELTSQTYEKIHPMTAGKASRTCEVTVEEKAYLMYNLLPVIPFADSVFESKMVFRLQDKSSRMIFVDTMSCGRVARNERFAYRKYQSLVEIYTGEQLIFRDNTCFVPTEFDMEAVGMFEGYSHYMTVIFCNCSLNEEKVQYMRNVLDSDAEIQYGISVLQSTDVVVKILGRSGQQLTDLCQRVCGCVVGVG